MFIFDAHSIYSWPSFAFTSKVNWINVRNFNSYPLNHKVSKELQKYMLLRLGLAYIRFFSFWMWRIFDSLNGISWFVWNFPNLFGSHQTVRHSVCMRANGQNWKITNYTYLYRLEWEGEKGSIKYDANVNKLISVKYCKRPKTHLKPTAIASTVNNT